MANTGLALTGVCEAIDGTQTVANGMTSIFHCCVNRNYNKMKCATTDLASTLGILTDNGENTCDTTNSAGSICLDDDFAPNNFAVSNPFTGDQLGQQSSN